jgi:sugar phosphate isomerase/epimerase
MNKVILAPTTLPDTPPLEFVRLAAATGYDGIGLRLHKSPVYPQWPNWLGDAALKRDVKAAIGATDLEVVDILSFYLEPDMDFDEMLPALEYGAELGAHYALVIGDDPEWRRMCDNFGHFCDVAAGFGLVAALESPVRRNAPIARPLQMVAETGRQNAVLCLDPTNFMRAGDDPAILKEHDPRLFPYTQINDCPPSTPSKQCCRPGAGGVPLAAILDALPPGLPLSLEWWQEPGYSAADWASTALHGTRAFLEQYHTAV